MAFVTLGVRNNFKRVTPFWGLVFLSQILVGCLPSGTTNSNCPTGKSFDSATRSCVDEDLQEQSSNQAPDPGAPAVYSAAEGSVSVINFTVNSGTDNEGDTISYIMGTPPSNGTIKNCMDLTGSSGLDDRSCMYELDPEFVGTAVFKYRLHDGHQYGEQLGLVEFVIGPVNDAPVFMATPNVTATAYYEDTPAYLEFTIDEGNGGADEDTQSLYLQVKNMGNTLVAPNTSITVYYANTPVATAHSTAQVQICASSDCEASLVKVKVNPSPNTNTTSGTWGTSGVNIQIKATDSLGASTTYSTGAFSIQAVNDAPTFPTATPLVSATANEDTHAYAALYVDEGGGTDENTQTMSVAIAATAVSGTPVPVTQVAFVYNGASLGDGSSTRNFGDGATSADITNLKIYVTPIADQSGTTRYALTLSDSSGESVSASFAVTFNAVDDAPTFPTSPAIATTTAVAYATEDTSLSLNFTVDEGGGSPEDAQNLLIMAQVEGTCAVFGNDNMTLLKDSVALTNFTPGAWVQLESDSSTDFSTKVLTLVVTPTPNANGVCGVSISLNDDAAATPTATPTAEAVASFSVNFGAVNDAPVIASPTADLTLNEGTKHFGLTMVIDEGGLSGGATPMDEDSQGLLLKVSTDNSSLLPLSRIYVYKYDGSTFNPSSTTYTSLGDNTDDHLTTNLKMDIWPVHGYSGTANLTLTLSDGYLTTTQLIVVTVNDNTFTWNGWEKIKAYGPSKDYWGTPVGTSGPYSYLKWPTPEVIGTGASISGHHIYRIEDPGDSNVDINDFDLTAPITTAAPISNNYFEDNSDYGLEAQKAYWYLVLPINGNNNQVMMNYGDDRLIRVVIPDENRALVHRWMVNKEICENLGLAPDRANHYSCYHQAPGVRVTAVATAVVDLNYDLVVDRYEASCNFARGSGECDEIGSSCVYRGNPNNLTNEYGGTGVSGSFGSLYYDRETGQCWVNTDGGSEWKKNSCQYSLFACDIAASGADDNCIGNNAPGPGPVTAGLGDYYLDYSNQMCYYNTAAGNNWVDESNADVNIAQISYQLDYTNASATRLNVPKNPPLVFFDQKQASVHCDQFNLEISNLDNSPYLMRLPNRGEQIAMNRWDSSVTISTKETGGDLSSSSVCNTTESNGLTYVSSKQVSSGFWDTLPAAVDVTATYELTPVALRSVVTGSESTQDCASVYGIQDGVGNVKEWGDEIWQAASPPVAGAGDYEDFSLRPNFASGTPASDLYGLDDDGMGPYPYEFNSDLGTALGPDADQTGGNRFWVLSTGPDATFDDLYLQFGLPTQDTLHGTPVAASSTTSYLSDDLIRFGNEFWDSTAGAPLVDDNFAAFAHGGAYYSHGGSSNDSGRFSTEMIRLFYSGADTGFRCVTPVGYE